MYNIESMVKSDRSILISRLQEYVIDLVGSNSHHKVYSNSDNSVWVDELGFPILMQEDLYNNIKTSNKKPIHFEKVNLTSKIYIGINRSEEFETQPIHISERFPRRTKYHSLYKWIETFVHSNHQVPIGFKVHDSNFLITHTLPVEPRDTKKWLHLFGHIENIGSYKISDQEIFCKNENN